MLTKLELLAPAGDLEKLKVAVLTDYRYHTVSDD